MPARHSSIVEAHLRSCCRLWFAVAFGMLLSDLAQAHSPAVQDHTAPSGAPAGTTYAQAVLASSTDRKIVRAVDSGAASVVARATFWTGGCSARAVTVTIRQPPTNGTAAVTEGLNPVVENPRFGTAGTCAGREIMGKQVVYQSSAGFRGSDVLVYESVSDRGERSLVTVAIEVR